MNTAAMPSVLSPSAPSAPTPVPKGGHGETPFSHCLDQACEQPDETDPATAYASKDTPGSVPTKLETVAKAKSHAPRTDKAAAVATLATPTQAVRSDPIAAPASDAPILAAGKSDLS